MSGRKKYIELGSEKVLRSNFESSVFFSAREKARYKIFRREKNKLKKKRFEC